MASHIQNEIAKLPDPARQLAQLMSDLSLRIFKEEWNGDIEWDVRNAMDDNSFQIKNVDSQFDPNQGLLNQNEITQLKQLRSALQDGWVYLDGLQLRRHGPQTHGSLIAVSAQQWNNVISTDAYRLKRYDVI